MLENNFVSPCPSRVAFAQTLHTPSQIFEVIRLDMVLSTINKQLLYFIVKGDNGKKTSLYMLRTDTFF